MQRKYVLLLLAFINFTHIVDSMLIMPLGDMFINEFDISSGQYSILVSAYAIAATISSLIGTFVLDKFDRRRALIIMYTGFAIGTFLCAFAQSYTALLSLRFITGFFGGTIGALVLAIVSDLYLFKERGKAMGVLMGAFSAAAALGIPIGLFLAAKGSWNTPFWIIGAVGALVSALLIWKFPKMTDHLKSQEKGLAFVKTIKNITNDGNQINALWAGFILVLGHFMIIPFISPYYINNVGITQLEISYQFFFGGLATIVSSIFVGRWTDKFGFVKVFTTMMLLSFIPVIMITNLGVSPLWYAVSLSTLFFITASGRMIPANTIITAAVNEGNRGSFMSLKSSLQQFAIAIAALVSGLIMTQDENSGQFSHYEIVGYISVVIGVITIYFVNKIKVAQGN